jgi:hypothetical protein
LIFANPDGTPLKPDSVSAPVSALCRRLKLRCQEHLAYGLTNLFEIAETIERSAPCLFGRHAGLDVALDATLDVEAQFVVDFTVDSITTVQNLAEPGIAMFLDAT